MDWFIPTWGYWLAIDGTADPWHWMDGPAAPVSRLDLWLIHLTYDFATAESTCTRCGSALGRGIRVVPSSTDDPPGWTVSVETRCSGWRRHRHVATVDGSPDDLVLGPLHLV
jgi:hypothetical protein